MNKFRESLFAPVPRFCRWRHLILLFSKQVVGVLYIQKLSLSGCQWLRVRWFPVLTGVRTIARNLQNRSSREKFSPVTPFFRLPILKFNNQSMHMQKNLSFKTTLKKGLTQRFPLKANKNNNIKNKKERKNTRKTRTLRR